MRQVEEEDNSWRQNWFVKNVLAEISIVGGFFQTAQLAVSVQHVLKHSFMMFAGVSVMLLDIMQVHMDDSNAVKFGKMSATMIVGMTSGAVLYNGLFAAVSAIKKSCQKPADGETAVLLDIQPTF